MFKIGRNACAVAVLTHWHAGFPTKWSSDRNKQENADDTAVQTGHVHHVSGRPSFTSCTRKNPTAFVCTLFVDVFLAISLILGRLADAIPDQILLQELPASNNCQPHPQVSPHTYHVGVPE